MDEHDLMEILRDFLNQAVQGSIDGSIAMDTNVDLLNAQVRLTPGAGPSCEVALEDGTRFVVSVTQIGGDE